METVPFHPDPLRPALTRQNIGGSPQGSSLFEDIQSPNGWTWEGKKWELDLEAREWVSERLVTGVEYDILSEGEPADTEFGGWVWDLPGPESPAMEEEMWVAYHNGDTTDGAMEDQTGNTSNKELGKSWEENTARTGRTGAWRRRRWVRTVKRIGVGRDSHGLKSEPKSPT